MTQDRTAERFIAITALTEAAGREGLARHLASHTSMTVDQARLTLRQAPLTLDGQYRAGAAEARALLAGPSPADGYAEMVGAPARQEQERAARAAAEQAKHDRGAAEARAALGKS